MSEAEVKAVVIEELENLGIIIDDEEDDNNILSVELDSISFISLIVAIEERLKIQFPDDFLTMDVISSINGFSNLVYTLLSN